MTPSCSTFVHVSLLTNTGWTPWTDPLTPFPLSSSSCHPSHTGHAPIMPKPLLLPEQSLLAHEIVSSNFPKNCVDWSVTQDDRCGHHQSGTSWVRRPSKREYQLEQAVWLGREPWTCWLTPCRSRENLFQEGGEFLGWGRCEVTCGGSEAEKIELLRKKVDNLRLWAYMGQGPADKILKVSASLRWWPPEANRSLQQSLIPENLRLNSGFTEPGFHQ